MASRKIPRFASPVKRAVEKRENRKASAIVANLKKFIPKFKEYGRRKTFTEGERRYIHKVGKALQYTRDLTPVTKKQAWKLKQQLFVPMKYVRDEEHGETYQVQVKGVKVQAIQTGNMGKVEHFRIVDNDINLVTNGRPYIMWRLDDVSTTAMKKAGQTAFTNFQQAFPVERLARLAEYAFSMKKVKHIYLWGSRGRCAEPFDTFDAFMEWLIEEYAHYKEKEEWVNGLILAV